MIAPAMTLDKRETSDEELAQAASRDPVSFAELYQRHFLRIYRYHCVRTGDSQDAQDLTTQTFLAALEALGSFQGKGSFIAWLYGIARHKAALHFRGKARQVSLEASDDYPDPATNVEEITEKQLELARVSQALDELSPERAEAILLCLFSGLSNQQAAEVMGKSPTAVKMLIFRGLKELRLRLAPILKEA